MSGYIGTQPVPQATQTRDAFTATNNQTSFPTSGYTPEFLDVFLNGVKLAAADYTATNGSDVVLAAGATTGDILEVVSYGTFEVLNPTFDGNVTFTGNASFGDNDKAIFGDGSDLQIYHDGSQSYIDDAGTGRLNIRANDRLYLRDTDDSVYAVFYSGAGSFINHNGNTKLSTTSSGIDVTGTAVVDALTSSGNVLIGTTDSNVANNSGSGNDGVSIQPDSVRIARTDGDMLLLNRLNSDGDIAKFLKDGATVGSIGTGSGTVYFTNSTTGGIRLGTTSGATLVLPCNESGATEDAAHDLGYSSIRWRDLYLSGGVSLDGSSGNTLYKSGSDLVLNNRANATMIFGTNNTERMRIDSSGNLLVGKTSTGGNVAGHQFNSNGAGYITRDGASVLHVNRKTSDGEIISIRKNDVAVGSIGVQSTDQLYIATPDGSGVGLIFDGDNRKIDPTDGAGSNLDNAVDLGTGAYRFKDAYIGGGVYLGGTGSANKLEDYEEGSYNTTLATDTSSTVPTFAGTTYYVKVGDMVHIHGQVAISGSSSGGINLHVPLPFTPITMRGALAVGINQPLSMKSNGEYLTIIVETNSAKGYIVSTAFGGGHSHLGFNECGTGLFSFSGSYRTA